MDDNLVERGWKACHDPNNEKAPPLSKHEQELRAMFFEGSAHLWRLINHDIGLPLTPDVRAIAAAINQELDRFYKTRR